MSKRREQRRKRREARKEEAKQIGKLESKYRFALNPHAETRLSRCPDCNKSTRIRKVPLAIFVKPHYLLNINKVCRYCPDCDLLIAHQDELEHFIALAFEERDPSVIGNDYVIAGTIGHKAFWKSAKNEPMTRAEWFENLHDFKQYLTIVYDPGGWGSAEPEDTPNDKE